MGGAGGDGGDNNGNNANGGDNNLGDFSGNGDIAIGNNGNGGDRGDATGGESLPKLLSSTTRAEHAVAIYLLCCRCRFHFSEVLEFYGFTSAFTFTYSQGSIISVTTVHSVLPTLLSRPLSAAHCLL